MRRRSPRDLPGRGRLRRRALSPPIHRGHRAGVPPPASRASNPSRSENTGNPSEVLDAARRHLDRHHVPGYPMVPPHSQFTRTPEGPEPQARPARERGSRGHGRRYRAAVLVADCPAASSPPCSLRFLRPPRGLGFAIACVPPHLVYFLYSLLSYLFVLVEVQFKDTKARPDAALRRE